MLNRLTSCLLAALLSCLTPQLVAQATKAAKTAPAVKEEKDTTPVLVVVNGQPITERDLDRLLRTRQVPEAMWAGARERFLEQLIDARLIQGFLDSRQTVAVKEEVDEQVRRIREFAAKEGDPDKILSAMGYTEKSLRDEFALPLAWKRHVNRVVPANKLKEYFAEHRQEFDGTKVRASHILIRVTAPRESDEWKTAEEKLRQLRVQIVQKKLTFADAAKANSDGPSKESGGDLGYFPYSGKMSDEFSRVAFGLKVGEISEPFRSRFGVHLCLVTDRQPGELSLEDVRDEVFARIAQELWDKTVAELRASTKIERKSQGEGR